MAWTNFSNGITSDNVRTDLVAATFMFTELAVAPSELRTKATPCVFVGSTWKVASQVLVWLIYILIYIYIYCIVFAPRAESH
jgi:hypothetical protein